MNSATMRAERAGLFCLALTFVARLTAGVSAGVFSLDQSLGSATSQSATGGGRVSR